MGANGEAQGKTTKIGEKVVKEHIPIEKKDSRLRLAAYVLIAVVGAYGLWNVSESAEDAKEAADDVETAAELAQRAAEVANTESQRRTVEICEAGNSNREVILQLVFFAAEDGGTDFSQVEGFDQLDPEVQQFFRNLGSLDREEGESAFVQRARELLAPHDCQKLIGR